MTAGLANAKKKSRRDIKHAMVDKWVIEALARNANVKNKSRRDIKHAKVAKWVIETLARNMKPIQHKVYNVN